MQYEHLLKEIDIQRPDGLELKLKDTQKVPKTKVTKEKAKNAKIKESPKKNEKPVASQPPRPAEIQKENAPTEEDDAEIDEEIKAKFTKAKFEAVVKAFVESEAEVKFEFPATLTSYERMVVHEVAEAAGLVHESVGEGKKRHIVLTKKRKPVNPEEKPKPPKPEVVTIVKCSTCDKDIPKSNIELHKLKCTAVKVETGTKMKAKKKKKKDSVGKDEEDIDKLLASFEKIDNVCNMDKCKVKIKVLAAQCGHCRLRFCLEHGLPEVHGCGDAARRAARQQISRDGKLYAGSGVPSHKPDPVKRAQLQRKLDKKIDSLQENRAAKPPKSKK